MSRYDVNVLLYRLKKDHAFRERFRGRGLVRSLFAVHHQRAAEAGELLQVIGGIPYFYRKLGYGYGFDVPGTYSVGVSSTPSLDESSVEVRPMRADDVAWLVDLESQRPRVGVTVRRGEAVARRLEAGAVDVNDTMLNYTALELPMGGWKASGLGARHGAGGIRKYCRQQVILVSRLHPKRDVHHFPYREKTSRLVLKGFRLLWGRGKRD